MRRQPKPPPSFPALVQAFFVEHLTQQRALSPQTVAAYRDAFMLFLRFAEARLGRVLEDLPAEEPYEEPEPSEAR